MSTSVLAVLILGTTAAVVVALFLVTWRERTSSRDLWVAISSGCALTAWAALTTVLAYKGSFLQSDAGGAPPVGIWQLLGTSWARTPERQRTDTRRSTAAVSEAWRAVPQKR